MIPADMQVGATNSGLEDFDDGVRGGLNWRDRLVLQGDRVIFMVEGYDRFVIACESCRELGSTELCLSARIEFAVRTPSSTGDGCANGAVR